MGSDEITIRSEEAQSLFAEVRKLVLSARKSVRHVVDVIQVATNFEIGRLIVEHEQQGARRAEYGEALLKAVSERMIAEFGRGFSVSNLEYMRRFYLMYREKLFGKSQTAAGKSKHSGKPQTVSGQLMPESDSAVVEERIKALAARLTLSWSHYVFLMGVKDPEERSFYEIEATEQKWSLRELKRQFNSGLYERLALSRDKEGVRKLSTEGQVIEKPQDLLKEPYVLEFLGLDEKSCYSESDLESAIIDKLEHFLLELGKGFLFEARQKRFTFDEDHFFIDLVFYNRLLRCYVLIDLKIGKLTHQDLGQMQMYVNYFDRRVKLNGENSTVGIILCKSKHDALVEITLPKDANIHAKEYQLYLPSKEQLRQKLIDWVGEQETDE